MLKEEERKKKSSHDIVNRPLPIHNIECGKILTRGVLVVILCMNLCISSVEGDPLHVKQFSM